MTDKNLILDRVAQAASTTDLPEAQVEPLRAEVLSKVLNAWESTPAPDRRQTFGERLAMEEKVAIPTGAIAGAMTPLPGGAVGGALTGGLAALGTSALGHLTQEIGGSEAEQTAVELLAGIAMPSAGAAARAVTGVGRAARALTKEAGAAERVGEVGLIRMGAPSAGAARAAERVVRGVGKLEDEVDELYKAWRGTVDETIGLPAQYVQDAFKGIAHEGRFGVSMTPIQKLNLKPAEYEFTADDLNALRHEFSAVAAKAFGPGGDPSLGRRAQMAKKTIDSLEEELARKAGNEDSLAVLREARARRALLGEIVSSKGDRLVGDKIVKVGTRSDNAQEAFHKIMTADRSLESLRQMRRAAEIDGGQEAIDLLNNDLRRAATSYLFGRGPGATAETSVQSAGAVLRKMETNEIALRSIYGKTGYEFIRGNLQAVEDSVKGGSLEPVVRAVSAKPGLDSVLRFAMFGAVGAGGASAAGASGRQMLAAGLSAAAIGAGGRAIDAIASTYGPIAARQLAIRALYDPRVFAQVTKRVGTQEGPALAARIMEAAVRRGILTAQDFATLEGDM